jgi:hypothetical protein
VLIIAWLRGRLTYFLSSQSYGDSLLSQRNCQANAYLSILERQAFVAYAQKFFLDPAGLLALLLARELRLERLAELIKTDEALPSNRAAKVTVRLTSNDHGVLTKIAGDNSVSLSYACAVLARAELRERWLDQACATRFES